MMKRILTIVVVFLASGCFHGCSKPSAESSPEASGVAQQESVPATADSKSPQVGQAVLPAPESPPDKVLADFLKALRDGDESLAESLLTTKAKEETAKRNLAVQPPGSPSASFQIGKVDYVADDQGAHVNSNWTEKDDQGNSVSYAIVWIMRRQPAGWRIAGMATQVTASSSPVYLNFEDPDDMLRKWRAAEAALAAEQSETVRQANREGSEAKSNVTR